MFSSPWVTCIDSIILSTTCYCIYSQFQKFKKIFILFIFDFQLEIWGKFCSILEGNLDVKNIIIVGILPSFFSCLGSSHSLHPPLPYSVLLLLHTYQTYHLHCLGFWLCWKFFFSQTLCFLLKVCCRFSRHTYDNSY